MSEFPEVKEEKQAKVRKDLSSHFLTYKYLLAASLAALIISTFASWFFYSRWNEAEDRYSLVLKEKTDLSQNFDRVKADFDTYLNDFVILKDPFANVYQLNPVDSGGQYICRIYWNRFTKDVYIDAINLPLSANYHLWGKGMDSIPVDCGKFISDSQTL